MNHNNSWQGLKRRVGVWDLKEIPHLPPVVTICILSPLLSSTILLHCGTIWPNRSGSNFPTYRLVAWRHQPSAEPVLTNHQLRFSFAPESDSTRGLMNWTWVRRLHFLKYYHIPEKQWVDILETESLLYDRGVLSMTATKAYYVASGLNWVPKRTKHVFQNV